MPMRLVILLTLLLASCGLPNQTSLAPAPAAASPADLAAARAFAGRIPLVIIPPGAADYTQALASAVAQALAIKPQARFEVAATIPAAATPDATATALRAFAPQAIQVAQAMAADGVAPANIRLTAQTAVAPAKILVYVK